MLEVISTSGMAAKALTGLEIDLPVVCKLGMVDGRPVAGGGLCWASGKCWIWFFLEPDAPSGLGFKAIKNLRTMLRKAAQLGEAKVYAIRDPAFETSERLCKLAGFQKTGEEVLGCEVWYVGL